MLSTRIAEADSHHAICALCGDEDGKVVPFHIANNRGESSSIFTPTLHQSFFPEITFDETKRVNMVKLDSLLADHNYAFNEFDTLVVDVQGAELIVLEGAKQLLVNLKAIYIEVSEVPLYEGSCTLPQIISFLTPYEFKMRHLHIGAHLYGNALFVKI